MRKDLFEHPLVGRTARWSVLGYAYVIVATLLVALRAVGGGSGNLVMLVFLSSLVVPILYGLLNGGPALAFVMPLPLFGAFVLDGPTIVLDEAVLLLLPGFIGATAGLYTTGVRSTGAYLPAPHPGYETNLLIVTGALLVTVTGLAAGGALDWLARVPFGPPADWGVVDAVVLGGMFVALPVVGVLITLAYWGVWIRNRD